MTSCHHHPFVLALLASLLATPLAAQTGYQAHIPPRTVTFEKPTPAFDPENPARTMGDFRTGLSADVIEARPADGHWLVKYRRSAQDDILALIPIPNLANPDHPAFQRMLDTLKEFPLLHRILEHETPWPAEWTRAPRGVLSRDFITIRGSGDSASRFECNDTTGNTAWDLEPLRVYYDVSNPKRPKFVAEFWSKGEAFRRPGFRDEPARNELRRNLQHIARFFDSSGNSILRERGSNPHIRGIRDNVESFLLPNDTRVSIHYHRGEYLFVEIDQASVAARHQTVERTPAELARHLREQVRQSPNGATYIHGIPMIDQGLTSYCVPATMARVLNFYGYDVNTHSLAMLAGTLEQTSLLAGGGTTREDMMRSLRRITTGSPFQLREIANASLDTIHQIVESGAPILWMIDGHVRLLIGADPETGQIVYSDSWGPGHDFKEMDFAAFRRINRGMWVLQPR